LNFEWKVREKEEKNLMKKCWIEKVNMLNKELYSRQREKFFNRNGWSVEEIENMWDSGLKIKIENMIRDRERDIQRQTVDSRIREERYNKRYKEVGVGIERPSYLRREILDIEGIGDKVRALLRLRCGNMERENRY